MTNTDARGFANKTIADASFALITCVANAASIERSVIDAVCDLRHACVNALKAAGAVDAIVTQVNAGFVSPSMLAYYVAPLEDAAQALTDAAQALEAARIALYTVLVADAA